MFPDEVPPPVNVGDIVAGKYRIEKQIGRGGMGVVMAAHHLTLDQPVALKFVLDRGGNDGEAVERLVREARAMFRLRSPHAVRVHDVGRMSTGPVYIVMELLEGRDLRAELLARGPLPVRDVVAYALDVCDALEEAHAAGIVHRDLKPHNLFLTRSLSGKPIVKVLDFGLSKLDAQLFDAGPLTRPQTALGTPQYMAPEQWAAAQVDARADVWGLGTVMYELLTGKSPLHGLPWQDRRARLQAGAIPSPRDVRPEVSEALARVVLKCLRADPSVRWASALHLAQALRHAVPEVVAPPPMLATTRQTGITAIVPPDVGALLAARAFGKAEETSPPTRPEAPEARKAREARDAQRPEPHDFADGATEIRAPLFTAEDLSGPAPQRLGEERVVARTLHSQAVPRDMAIAIADARRQVAAIPAHRAPAPAPAHRGGPPPHRQRIPLEPARAPAQHVVRELALPRVHSSAGGRRPGPLEKAAVWAPIPQPPGPRRSAPSLPEATPAPRIVEPTEKRPRKPAQFPVMTVVAVVALLASSAAVAWAYLTLTAR